MGIGNRYFDPVGTTPKPAGTATWRTRLPVVAVVVACVAGVVAAVTGAANPVSAVQFLLPGHWVYNGALGGVFHVDGATGAVDAQARVDGEPGDVVVQNDRSGYVVGDSRITEFGKSNLEVVDSSTPASKEMPVPVETVGGPYLVYREAGKIARLGRPAGVLTVGGPVGDPVATPKGVVWVPRTTAGRLCQVRPGQRNVSCPVSVPAGHRGAMTVVRDRPMFVDTTEDRLYPVEDDGLGPARELGIDVPEGAQVAATDIAGRVAILDGDDMHLVDTRAAGAEPVKTIDLPAGDYTAPVSTGTVVAVVDRTTNTLTTYDGAGEERSRKELPIEDGEPRLTLGEDDRVYVDDPDGEHVVVVDEGGELTDVPITAGDGEGGDEPPGGSCGPSGCSAQPRDPVPGGTREPSPPRIPTAPTTPTTQNQPPPADVRSQQQPPQVPPSAPGAPSAVTATAGDGSATLTWGVPPDNRSPITLYTVSWPGGSRTVSRPSATITGLVNGTTYVFTVSATNAAGTGPGASSNPVTPAANVVPPSPPTNVAVQYDAATRNAVLSWAPPANLGGGTLTHYLVTAPGVAEQPVTGQTTTFTNVQGTGTLTFTVKAVTRAPDGTALTSAAAAATAEAPARRITVVQGDPTEEFCGESPACSWMHVELTGFPPNTPVEVTAHSTQEGYNNSYTTTTDANGFEDFDRFAYAGVGYQVHVVAHLPDGTTVQSEPITWQDR